MELFEAMQQEGMVPHVTTYSALIQGLPQPAIELFVAMQQESLVRNSTA